MKPNYSVFGRQEAEERDPTRSRKVQLSAKAAVGFI